MNLDEALAIYLFLQHRPPGTISERERAALKAAWEIICRNAEVAIHMHPR